MNDRTLIATDLDRTLIYSRAALGSSGAPIVAVERHRDEDASFMAVAAADAYRVLRASALVVPTSTRTRTQLRRITLPGPPARYEVAANGGVLLVDGSGTGPGARQWSLR